LSDRFGRRRTGSLFLLGFTLALLAFYSVTGWIAPLLWVVYAFFSMGSGVTLSAYSAELFPTSMRSSASGATSLAGPLGGIVGLAAVSALFSFAGSTWNAILLVGAIALVLPLIIYLFFPETARRALHEIAPEPRID
jgi:putative MFS transporter